MLDRYTWVASLSPPGGSLHRYSQRTESANSGRQLSHTFKLFSLFSCTLQTLFDSFIVILSSFWAQGGTRTCLWSWIPDYYRGPPHRFFLEVENESELM